MAKMVTARFINRDHPGEEIQIVDNGTTYQIQDGAIVTVPESVVNGVNECVRIEYDMKPEHGAVPVAKEVRPYLVNIVSDKEVMAEDSLSAEIIKNKREK